MFDGGDFATGNVRVSRDLRRRWNGNGNRNDNARQRRHDGRRSAVGNINVVGNIDLDSNLADVGRIDILRNGGNVGADGNVRLRFDQHHGIVEPNVKLICHVEQRRPLWNSVGILSDRQSRSESGTSGTDAKRIDHHRYRGTEFAGTNDAHRLIHDRKHGSVRQSFRLERQRS
jgi:hypothetical protein